MFCVRWIGGFALFTMLHVASAASQSLVLNCRAVKFEGVPVEWHQIDRIEIDEARPAISFTIANTIGTTDVKKWTFATQQDKLARDQILFERVDGSLRIAAFRLGSPTIIWVERSAVRVVILNKVGIDRIDFDCR